MNQSPLLPIIWKEGKLFLLDQRVVPLRKEYLECNDLISVIKSIKSMATRGAPAIAIAGAFGIAMEIAGLMRKNKPKISYKEFQILCKELLESRPTAVNLSRMLNDLQCRVNEEFWGRESLENISRALENFALEEFEKDISSNKKIGQNALQLFPNEEEIHIVTHCNTGSLATAGHGTALGIIRSLVESGKKVHVFANETRPFLQGSRLTAFEMKEEGIPCDIITDGMSSWVMSTRKIHAVIVGCDRIARNGDVANKIGTCNLAIVAQEFNVPFYVAGTKDSFDVRTASGREIPIEMRDPREVTAYSFLKDKDGKSIILPGTTSPVGVDALNPGFDITPAKFIKNIITEEGVFRPGELPPSLHFQ